MKTRIATLAATISTLMSLTACATSGGAQVAEATPTKTCTKSLGSHICREEGSGSMSNVKTISGDELRRGMGAGTGTSQGLAGN
jgi:hypothetical protein